MKTPLTVVVPALAVATAFSLALTLGLSGCSTIKDSLSGRQDLRFADYADAEQHWTVPRWVPHDATDIMVRTTGDGSVQIVHADSATQPAGGDCAPAERRYIPGMAGSWSPDDFPDHVIRCGDFEIMPDGDGWFGWTVTPSETTNAD